MNIRKQAAYRMYSSRESWEYNETDSIKYVQSQGIIWILRNRQYIVCTVVSDPVYSGDHNTEPDSSSSFK